MVRKEVTMMVVPKTSVWLKVFVWGLVFGTMWSVASSAGGPEEPKTSIIKPGLHHILIEVSDIKKSLIFYRDCLGLVLTSQTETFVTLESENSGIYLSQNRWNWEKVRAKGERNGLGMYPHFNVPDIAIAIGRFKTAGYVIVQKPIAYDWGSEAFVQDPDGYIIALVTMAKTK
jgi:catechol 2,3-dioxygenase-like lactoylglutathione lyase family enzyme